ncbi:MAG: hypothetical protein ACK5MG_08260 [Bacteroidales bacterium]
MKKVFYLIMPLCMTVFAMSCSNDDDSDIVNGGAVDRYITRITTAKQGSSLNRNDVKFTYNGDGSLNKVSDEIDSIVFEYDKNGDLEAMSQGAELTDVIDFYKSPYSAFEEGDVLAYDDNGNPKTIEIFETNSAGDIEKYTAEISYETAHNPYYSTLKAGGIIEVLNNVDLNFGSLEVPTLVKAKTLFPVNNLKKIIYKDETGKQISAMTATYVYNADNYPTSAEFTSVNEHGDASVANVTYEYKD